MDNTALFTRLSRPTASARKANPTTKQVVLCVIGVLLLVISLWGLAALHLSNAQFVLGMLVSVVVSLAFIVSGFIAAMRDLQE